MGNRYPTSGKISRSHTTMIEAAEVVVQTAVKDDYTKKVSLGIIDNRSRCKDYRLKFKPINGGLQVIVYGIGNHQELYIYTDNVEAAKILLQTTFLEKYPHAIIE